MRNDMKNTSILTLLFILTGLAPVCAPSTAVAAVLQSFDQLFLGDDATEIFEFNLSPDPAVPTTLRFAGFVENLHTNREGAVRFFLGWQTNSSVGSDGVTIASLIFPPWPDYLHPPRLPAADPVSGPVRVPVEFQAEVGYSPSWVKFAVEGLTDDDNFRFVGELTIDSQPRLRVSHGGGGAVQLAWTTNSAGFRLESSATFPGSTWMAVTNAATVVGREFSVRIEAADTQRIYRLRKL